MEYMHPTFLKEKWEKVAYYPQKIIIITIIF